MAGPKQLFVTEFDCSVSNKTVLDRFQDSSKTASGINFFPTFLAAFFASFFETFFAPFYTFFAAFFCHIFFAFFADFLPTLGLLLGLFF
jgi:hypothetical protein